MESATGNNCEWCITSESHGPYGDLELPPLPNLRTSFGLFSGSTGAWTASGWLDEEPEDSDEVPLGRDGVSFLGGLSVKDRFGGGMVAATMLLLPSRPSVVLANAELVVPAVIAFRRHSAGVRLVRTREVFEKRSLP